MLQYLVSDADAYVESDEFAAIMAADNDTVFIQRGTQIRAQSPPLL